MVLLGGPGHSSIRKDKSTKWVLGEFDFPCFYWSPGDDAAAANSGPFLQDEIMSLKGLELITEQAEPVQPAPEPVIPVPAPVVEERKPAEKKPVKPKWLKLWYV